MVQCCSFHAFACPHSSLVPTFHLHRKDGSQWLQLPSGIPPTNSEDKVENLFELENDKKMRTHKNGQDDGNPESSNDMQHGKYQPEQHQARVFQVHSDSQGNIRDDH